LAPPEEPGNKLYFSKTQLHSANGDIKTAREALAARGEKFGRQILRLERDIRTLNRAIEDSSERSADPAKATRFYPKAWMRAGQLIKKYHTLGYFKRRLEQDERKLKKMQETAKKLQSGKVRFAPRRITVWKSSIRFIFGEQPATVISLTDNKEPIKLKMQIKPEQPLSGSSKKSAEFYDKALLNFLAYAIKAKLMGFSNSAKFLLKAVKPDKVLKKDAMLRKRTESLPSKIREIEKWAGVKLSEEEINTITNEFETSTDRKTEHNEKFRMLLEKLATIIRNRKEPILLDKYGIIIRKPIGNAKLKNEKNVKPTEWEYYLQLGYAPALDLKQQYAPKKYIGLDRGVTHSVALSMFEPESGKFTLNKLYPNPLKDWKWRERRLIKSMQRLKRRIKAEKGETIHFNQMRKKIHSVETRADNFWHNLSSEIVKLAKENEAAIVMEKLENMRQTGRKKGKYEKALRYALSLFDYKKVASLIEYKATREGVPVFAIDPKYTSQTCSACLLADRKGNENPGDKYVRGINGNFKRGYCPVCREVKNKPGSEIDADLNAARVISLCVLKKRGMPQKVN